MSNPTIHPTQSNTREGLFPVLAGEDLTGKEACLVHLTQEDGKAVVRLPNLTSEAADYLLLEGAAAGELATVLPLDRNRNVRVRLSGSCQAGNELTLAPIDGSHDGQVIATPATAGTYPVWLRAEEPGVDGQLVLARPILNPLIRTIS